MQRGHGQRDEPAGLGRPRGAEPARHTEDTTRGEAVEHDAPAFPRVEPVLGQGEGARAGGGPRVDQRHLDDVEPLSRARQVRPRLVVDERDVGPVRDAGKAAGTVFEQVDERAIDLEAGDRAAAAPDGREDVATAADAYDGDVPLPHLIGQAGHVIRHPPQRLRASIPPRDRRGRLSVERQPLQHGREAVRAAAGPPEIHRAVGGLAKGDIGVRRPGGHRGVVSRQPKPLVFRIEHRERIVPGVESRSATQQRRQRHRATMAPAAHARKAPGRQRGGGRGDEHSRGQVGADEQRDHQQAPAGRPRQIPRVEPADWRTESRQRDGDSDA